MRINDPEAMADSKNHQHKDISLLSDEAFAALVEQEYIDQQSPQDELAKQKVWNVLDNRVNQLDELPQKDHLSKKITRYFSSILSVAAAAVMVLALVPLLSSYQVIDVERDRVKGEDDFPLVNLSAFTLRDDGTLHTVRGPRAIGDTIVFKLDLARPFAVALAMSYTDGKPQVRYRTATLQPGVARLLESGGKVYGYQLEREDKRLTFCAIAAENERRLSQKIRLLTRIWATLPRASCVTLDSAGT
jgi:hypothetical protein